MVPRTLRVAHSPDADDAYMATALARGLFDDEALRFELHPYDIATLNRWAPSERFDFTALSCGSIPFVADRYAVLRCGASFGEGYGPVVVSRPERSASEVRSGTVAVPGRGTTAALGLALAWPETRTVEASFDAIADLVTNGKVDGGLLIHEGQLTARDRGLAVHLDLGVWWRGETTLPLPLGVIVGRRALGANLREGSRRIADAIAWAREHHEEAAAYAATFAGGLPRETLERYLSMYANDRTLEMGEDGKAAVREFLARAAEARLVPPTKTTFVDDIEGSA